MNFAFLYPWVFLGGLAAGIPIWLHLRRRRETDVLRFSAVRFLEDQPRPRRGALRLRDILLLAFRLLALGLIVGAFAWPYDPRVDALVVLESRVYVLDNTLSHQADGGFVRDRDRIAAEIDALPREVQAAVVELKSGPRVVAGFGTERGEAVRAVRALVPSFERGSYLAAFRQASALLDHAMGDRREIVFLGDNQENQWTEETESLPFLREVEVRIPEMAEGARGNLAVADPVVQRVFLGGRSLVDFSARLIHTGQPEPARVVLRSNGQVIFDRRVKLEGEPPEILLQAQWEADPSLSLRGEIAVEGASNALAGDDRAFFALPPVDEGEVALLARSRHLRLALSPDVMEGRWSTRVLDVAALADEVSADDAADVLVLESRYLQSADARKLVRRYLDEERGVFLAVDVVTPVVSGALRELGFEPQDVADGGIDAGPARIQYVFSHHPVFRPFLSPDYGKITEIEVGRRHRLRAPGGVPLLFSETGEALFFQGTRPGGTLFVTAFGFDRGDSSWPLHLTFIPFLDLCLQNARPRDPVPATFEPGAVAVFSLPADEAGSREVVLRRDDEELMRVPVENGGVRLPIPGEPGHYELLLGGDAGPPRTLSINPSPKESLLVARNDPPALAAWMLEPRAEPGTGTASPDAGRIPLSNSAIRRQDFWWYLLVAATLALLVETIWTAVRRESV